MLLGILTLLNHVGWLWLLKGALQYNLQLGESRANRCAMRSDPIAVRLVPFSAGDSLPFLLCNFCYPSVLLGSFYFDKSDV